MKWEEVKNAHPSAWLLIEAIEAHTEGENRIIDRMSVIDSFQDKSSKPALLRYLELHKNFPDREFYVVHSEREHLDIKEQKWAGLGVRAQNEV
ncbi:hypothetical protein [Pseudobacteroides cellulosolvens]|uniref:Uncharacterized protein n=1 Tax=Pseudobacteroides cellulosolvens ATCC 35603 = DSM 2933 TaxID=398512 RepID=A0A0L6JQW5_9FIRM|nr:hypothetical protein [Pseudobacteroides cellulosolvens]KNY28183.1 hypothetical protein Bccel_3457 [Pseudobacteroides cellulosolvens ATCC 35603 = DSM 2933]